MAPNPVIPGFHPDPTVCRVGDDYYLACSSFEYFPGVPLFHSRDLLSWELIGNVLDRPSQLPLAAAKSSGGIYAPTLRHHGDRFWLITTNTSGGDHFIVTAEDPAEPWSEPVVVEGLPGFDPDLAWDQDGTCWCTYADFDERGSRIMQASIDPEQGKVLEEPRPMWSGTGLVSPEAPHLYRIDGWWYLVIAEGGTGPGHAVSVARASSPEGPFEGCPGNPVLSHRSLGSPIRNTGHADLVQGPGGRWWMVLLGVRPHGGFPSFHVLGRETFLTPVRWVDEWPVPEQLSLGEPGEAHDAGAGGVRHRDDFDAPALGPQWVSLRERPPQMWSVEERPGWLTLHATGDSLDDLVPAFVGRRQQHLDCRVRARVDAGRGRGGLVVRMDERHHYEVEAVAGEVRVVARIGPLLQTVAVMPVEGRGPVVLGVDVDAGSVKKENLSPPDLIRLGVEADGTFAPLATLDGRYVSTEVAGGFTGRVIGMYAAEGAVAFDWFDYAEMVGRRRQARRW